MKNIEKIVHWYAFVTRPRHEKKVKSYLDGAGIETYLPLKKTLNQWKDRKKWVESPLFSCYIFAKIPYIYRYDVLKTTGVVRIVSFNNRPTPVLDEEIEAIKLFLASNIDVNVHDGFVKGDDVRINSGPLSGMEGYLVDIRGRKWFELYISAIGKSVLVDFTENIVKKVQK